ncbi:DedA family protein [Bacillus sp. JCM 19041]|uniref:DedA family protein n=1 Tax=Bacillus sp. JCM 19041 TaxID=1460637 RepID=UPI0006CFF457
MEIIKELIIQYGYVGVFFSLLAGILGFPIPDEVLLLTIGYLSYIDFLHITPALIVSIVGSFLGMSLSYYLGIKLGAPFLETYGPRFYLSIKRQKQVHALLAKHGKWIIFFGFFIPGIRHLTGYLSGIAKLKYSTYAMFSGIGSIIWASGFILCGYVLGHRWLVIRENVFAHKILYFSIFFTLLTLIVTSYILYKHMANRYISKENVNRLKG